MRGEGCEVRMGVRGEWVSSEYMARGSIDHV